MNEDDRAPSGPRAGGSSRASARPHHNNRRDDRPELKPGAHVFWNDELYIAERVELQGTTWVVAIVHPAASRRPDAPTLFVPFDELVIDD